MSTVWSYREKQIYLAELTVYGFIREQRENDTQEDICWPEDLNKICLRMYLILIDEWSPGYSDIEMTIDAKHNIVKSIQQWRFNQMTAIGFMRVKKGDVQTWRIKTSNVIYLGVIDNDYNIGKEYLQQILTVDCIILNDAIVSSKDGIISMTLDMTGDKCGLLSFRTDEKDFGIRFDSLDIDKGYNLIAKMNGNSSVQLLQ